MSSTTFKNKKIKNAHPLEYAGIQFKSKLEKSAYIILKDAGFPVQYEPEKFIIWQGFKPTVPYYTKNKITKDLKVDNKKIIDITYTPDLLFEYNGYLIVIELKGFQNDLFPYKKKMFRYWLETNRPKSLYFEIYTKKQLLQAINLIKQLPNV